MTTALDLLTQGAREVGILGSRETLGAAAAADGLVRLNDMLESWRNERILCYQLLEENFSLTVNKRNYTIGPTGADFTTGRPLEILPPCFVREQDTDYPCEIIEKEGYGRLVSKSTVTANYPEWIYYEPSFPNGEIFLYPVPSNPNTLFFNSLKELQSFPTLATQVSLPPGYKEAIKYELGIRHAAKKGFAINPKTQDIADKALARIRVTNSKALVSRLTIPNVDRRRTYHIESDS